jgi:hypothetical protein
MSFGDRNPHKHFFWFLSEDLPLRKDKKKGATKASYGFIGKKFMKIFIFKHYFKAYH